MEKIVEQTLLYDFYGELLTEHQKKIYECYYLEDLSLSEISEQEGISRQGVYDTIKRCDKLLNNYETKLHLVEKFEINKRRVGHIYDLTCDILKGTDEATLEKVAQIQDIAKSIMEIL